MTSVSHAECFMFALTLFLENSTGDKFKGSEDGALLLKRCGVRRH